VWRAIRVALGIVLMGLGVIGTLMPLIPGFPLLLAGIATLGTEHPAVRSLLRWVKSWRERGGQNPGTPVNGSRPPGPLGTRSIDS